jgi:multiple sugar transport system substrate-binding protein
MSSTGKARRALLTIALLLATALLAACGGDDDEGGGGGGGGQAGGTLQYWASNQGATIDQDNEVLRRAIGRFKQQTGIDVEFKVIPWSDLFNNITTATTSGRGPDVLNIGNTWSASLQATGAFMPFEGEDLEAIGGQEKFLETSWAASGAPGQAPTSVPLYGLSYGLFYNRELFEEEGLEPPRTWSEFIDAAKQLTKDTNGDGKMDQWGVAVEGASITENAHHAFILGRQAGGQLFTDGKPTFDSPQITRGVQEYVDLIARHKVANPSNAQYSDGTQALAQFSEGKTGMVMWQNNATNNLEANGMKQSEYGVAEMPVMDGTDTPVMTHVAGINVSIFENSDNKEAAIQFVKFLTSPEEQVRLNTEFNSLPVVQQARENEAFQTEQLATFTSILAENAEPMPLIPEEGQMEQFIGDAVKQLFAQAATRGSVSPEQVRAQLNDANEQMAAVAGGGS